MGQTKKITWQQPKPPLVLAVDQSSETLTSIDALAKSVGSNRAYSIDETQFFRRNHIDMTNIYCLGHGSKSAYGKLGPEQFAKKINTLFSNTEKECVKTINLIGCEIGLETDKSPALAQQIANAIYEQGFINATVQAIATKASSGAALFVHVINDIDVMLGYGRKAGQLKAFVIDKTDIDEYNRIKSDQREHRRVQQLQQKALLSCNPLGLKHESNPTEELRKAQHTFIPNESLAKRKRRVDNKPASSFNIPVTENLARVAAKVSPIFNVLSSQPQVALKSENFEKEIATLNLSSNTKNRMGKHTHRLLDQYPKGERHTLFADKNTPHITVYDINHATKLGLNKKIMRLIDLYDKQINALNSGCFSVLNSFEIHTKQAKKSALQSLLKISQENGVEKLKKTASQFLTPERQRSGLTHWLSILFSNNHSIHRVIHSSKSNNMVDLLEEISTTKLK